MKLLYRLLLLIVFATNLHAASVEDILNYDLQGINLTQSINAIQSTVEAKGFSASSWPKNNSGNWKFEKKHAVGSEVYEVRLDRNGTVKSIRYQKSVYRDDQQAIDIEAAYKLLSDMATGITDNCRKFVSGGFQCVMHAGHGSARVNLSARTGRGSVSFTVSR